MKQLFGNSFRRIADFRKQEDGSALTIEFVFMFPVVFFTFLLAFDVGMHTLRQTMLERGVDIAVRAVRLSSAANAPNHDDLKRMICNGAGILPKCIENMNVEMRRNDMFNWSDWPVEPICADLEEEIAPVNVFEPGGSNELMLVRACAIVKPFFATWISEIFANGITVELQMATHNNSHGRNERFYPLVASSAFVNEPS